MKERKTVGLDWDKMVTLTDRMKEDGNRLYLIILIQSYTGLRIGDALTLKWKDFFNAEDLNLIEGKTKKERSIALNPKLQRIVKAEYEKQKFGVKKTERIFLNKKKTSTISISYINRELKKACKKYDVKSSGNISSHMWRKTMAVTVLKKNDYSNESVMLISQMLNHSSLNSTNTYLSLDAKQKNEAYLSL